MDLTQVTKIIETDQRIEVDEYLSKGYILIATRNETIDDSGSQHTIFILGETPCKP